MPHGVAVDRKYPIGAELVQGGGVHFRVWALDRRHVEVELAYGARVELTPEGNGYFSGVAHDAGDGSLYWYRLDGAGRFPDPASRFQPQGPHGPSQVVDPNKFQWTDHSWRGVEIEGQVIYEMHIGAFTHEGSWEAARRELRELAATGITLLEIMPVADFPGRFGWGYDGVGFFAPVAIYGTPDDFRRFVDDAHRAGLGVILDVVYNHLGPDGNYLKEFSKDYFTDRYTNEWGDAINFDGENSGPVREWVETNAAYWAEEFHLDGLRLDATQQIFDASPEHIITSLAKRMRSAAGERKVVLIAENEPQETKLIRPVESGGYGLDAIWNDDMHHSAHVALTGHNEAYYTDYRGKPQEFISSAKYGYLYQGQQYSWQAKRRGAPALDLPPARFVNYIDNHDQIANSGLGERTHALTTPGRYRAMTALLLLSPGTPMLFQGQEFASSSRFNFFADHPGELRELVKEGRIQFLSQFSSLAQPEARACHVDPGDEGVFERCKLDFNERRTHAAVYSLHKDLLRLRRDDPVFQAQRRGGLDGAVLGPEAFVLRFFGEGGDDRLLIVNLGLDLQLTSVPEPLLAPPRDKLWNVIWSSENPTYGGCGSAPLEGQYGWRIPGHAAVVLSPGDNPWPV